jgi:hypothetical protein
VLENLSPGKNRVENETGLLYSETAKSISKAGLESHMAMTAHLGQTNKLWGRGDNGEVPSAKKLSFQWASSAKTNDHIQP